MHILYSFLYSFFPLYNLNYCRRRKGRGRGFEMSQSCSQTDSILQHYYGQMVSLPIGVVQKREANKAKEIQPMILLALHRQNQDCSIWQWNRADAIGARWGLPIQWEIDRTSKVRKGQLTKNKILGMKTFVSICLLDALKYF